MKRIFALVFICLVSGLISPYAFASDGSNPAQLTGDILRVDLENRSIYAEGNVVLKYRDIVIVCNTLEMNAVSGELSASGDVEFREGEDVVTGARLTYDLTSKAGILESGKAAVKGDRMESPMYVTGSRFVAESGKVGIEGGSFTTCDLEAPHYRVEARDIHVYLGDRMELRQLSYWEGSVCVFRLPYLVIPLREDNRFDLPKIGYGEREGWFIKTTYNYYRNPSFRGFLYLDYFSRLGLGFGVKHFYDFRALGAGSLLVYELMNRTTNHGETTLELAHELSLGPMTDCSVGLKYSDSLSLSGVLNTEIAGSARIRYAHSDRSVDLAVDKKQVTGVTQYDQTQVTLLGRWKGAEGLSLSGDVRFFERQVREGLQKNDQYLNYRIEASKGFEKASFRAIAEQYVKPVDIKEKEEEGEVDPLPYEAIGRAPEIVIEGHPLRLGGFPLRLKWDVAFGRYAERTSLWPGAPILRGSKVHLGIDAVAQSYRLSHWLTGTLSGGLSYDKYSTGDSRYVLQGAFALQARAPDDAAIIYAKYDHCGVFGETPFAFDKKDRKGLLTGRLTLSRGIFTFSIDSGYDFYKKSHEYVTGIIRLSEGRAWAAEVSATYDPRQRNMERAVGKLEVALSDRCLVKTGVRYNFPQEALDRIESHVAFQVSDAWGVEWTVVYGSTSGYRPPGFIRGDVAVTRDMHCRELRLSYSYTENQVWLEYRIKAFPHDSVKMGIGEDGVLF